MQLIKIGSTDLREKVLLEFLKVDSPLTSGDSPIVIIAKELAYQMDLFIHKYFTGLLVNNQNGDFENNYIKVEPEKINEIYTQFLSFAENAQFLSRKQFDIFFILSVSFYMPFQKFIDDVKGLNVTSRSTLVSQLAFSLKITTPEAGDKRREGATIDHDRNILCNWLLSMMMSQMELKANPITLVLRGPKDAGLEDFFKHLLPAQLKSYYTCETFSKDIDKCLIGNNTIACFKNLDLLNHKTVKSFNDMVGSPGILRRFLSTEGDAQRLTSFCGTMDSALQRSKKLDSNVHIIDIDGIDWDIYNAIDKEMLFIDIYGMHQSAKQFFKA